MTGSRTWVIRFIVQHLRRYYCAVGARYRDFYHVYNPGVLNRTFGNLTQSNLIEHNQTIEFDCNQTKSNSQKNFANRTFDF